MESILTFLKRFVTPVFLVMLVVSFTLWYLIKLSYTYTTEYTVSINTDGEKYKVSCIFEGVGTNLISYHVGWDKWVKIPLSELKYRKSREEGHEGMIIIDPQSLQHAIAIRFSDVKVGSIGAIPEIPLPDNHD